MKRKLGAILLVVALVLSFGLVPAAPVMASPTWELVGSASGGLWTTFYSPFFDVEKDYDGSTAYLRVVPQPYDDGTYQFDGSLQTVNFYVDADNSDDASAGDFMLEYWHSSGNAAYHYHNGTIWVYGSVVSIGSLILPSGMTVTWDDGSFPAYVELGIPDAMVPTGEIGLMIYAGSYGAVTQFSASPGPGYGSLFDYTTYADVLFFTATLYAGQTIDVGWVTVWSDCNNLYVKYQTTDGWLMTETHLHVCSDLNKIPQTEAKGKGKGNIGGNPIPGQFAYQMEHDPAVDEYTYVIELHEEWPPCTELVIAAHAAVIKVEGDCGDPFWATDHSDYSPGDEVDSDPIQYDDPDDMLGAPDATLNGTWTGFASLGFGGSVVIYFDYPIFNGPSDYDISIHEVTGTTAQGRADYPEESASVEVLFDGVWHPAGTITNHDGGDGVGKISIPEALLYVEAVRITDTTNPEDYPVPPYYIADAYDIDAVDACFLLVQEETAWAGTEPGELPFPGKNWATYFNYHVQYYIELDATGDGTAEWSDEEAHSESNSALLSVPTTPASSAKVKVCFPPITFDDINGDDPAEVNFWGYVKSSDPGLGACLVMVIYGTDNTTDYRLIAVSSIRLSDGTAPESLVGSWQQYRPGDWGAIVWQIDNSGVHSSTHWSTNTWAGWSAAGFVSDDIIGVSVNLYNHYGAYEVFVDDITLGDATIDLEP